MQRPCQFAAARRAAAAMLSACLLAACAGTTVERPGARVAMTYNGIDAATAERIADRVAADRAKVREWWGPTFEGTIRVRVDPQYRITRAIVPAWLGDRGRLEVPARNPEARATLHEIVHIYAPNGNRFLAEGLAVYAQAKMGTGSVYPNFGEDLHGLARGLAGDADLAALDRTSTPNRLGTAEGAGERKAYIVAGSFVGFLIERYGMDRFRTVYARTPLVPLERGAGGGPERWHATLGKDLAELTAEWREFLKRQSG